MGVVLLAVMGFTALGVCVLTLVIVEKDGYAHRPHRHDYDTRRPSQ